MLSSCTPSETSTFQFYIYYPSLVHAFATSHFTKTQLDNVQRKALHSIIRKSGYCGSTLLEIRNGPRLFGGLAFRQLYCKQGVAQIIYFIKHWRTPGPINKMLKIVLSWLQAQCGTSFSIFDNTIIELPHLEELWFTSLLQFMQKYNITFKLHDTCVPIIQRENDIYIKG